MKNLYRGLLVAIGIFELNSSSWGQCFKPAISFMLNFTPLKTIAGDLNGDNKPDLVTANPTNNTISILLNKGNGGFTASNSLNINNYINSYPYAVAIADFNADSKPDLAVANAGSNTVSVLLGNGTGSFSTPTDFNVGNGNGHPYSIASGDFNGDGKPDLVTANSNNNTISVLPGIGDGTFGPVADFSVGRFPSSVALADFNRDGKIDVVTANSYASTVSILLGTGNGTFGTAIDFNVGAYPTAVVVADFNGDGKSDIATSGTTVSLLLADNLGGFSSAINFGTDNSPYSMVVSDFNGDGKPDLATSNNGSGANSVSILLNNGRGGFNSTVNFGAGYMPESVAVGDFDGDGKPDLVTANSSDKAISLLLNCDLTTPPVTPPTTSLTLAPPTYDCTTGLLSLSTTGGNGQPIDFRIAGLRDYGTSALFTVPTYQRTNTTFTLEARQSGQVVTLPFTSACQATTPTSPTQPTGTGLSLAAPAYDCTTGLLTLATSGGNGTTIDFRIIGLRDYGPSPTFIVPVYQRSNTTFTLEARQSGQVVSLPFTSACQSATTTLPSSPTQSTGTPLSVSAQALNCQTGALQLITTGGDGSAIDYKVPGLRDYGSSATFTVPTYQRSNTTFTLYARQNGREVTGTYAATCPVGTRLSSAETGNEFRVAVYPNPVGEQFSVGVNGAAGQVVRFHLTTLSGQTVVEQRVPVSSDAHTETLKLPTSGVGLYLLQVSTDSQSRTVKVLKP